MAELNEHNTFYASFFGTFELQRGDDSLSHPELRSRQATKLLAILIYHYKDPYPSAKLIDMLWPGTAEDPTHALSNLVYRLRKMLSELWPGEKLIILRNGVYQWNPDVPIEADAREFDSYAELAEKKGASSEAAAMLEHLVKCYKGRFLSDFTDDLDVLSVQNYYHSLYLRSVSRLIEYYEAEHTYSSMELLCQNAIHLDPMEEQLHCGMMQAFIGSNRFLAAENYYHNTVAQMQSYMGGMPTEQMHRIYQRMQRRIHVRETDLDQILADMAQQEQNDQAFICDYGFFQKMFNLQVKLKERDNIPVSIVLVSIYMNGEDIPGAKAGPAMEKLEEVLLGSLRQGDAIAKYSSSQYIIMLSRCSLEQTEGVMQRIRAAFYKKYRYNKVLLQHTARELE